MSRYKNPRYIMSSSDTGMLSNLNRICVDYSKVSSSILMTLFYSVCECVDADPFKSNDDNENDD